MKLIEWLKQLFGNKRASPDSMNQADGFIIIDYQKHIHTNEKIKRSEQT